MVSKLQKEERDSGHSSEWWLKHLGSKEIKKIRYSSFSVSYWFNKMNTGGTGTWSASKPNTEVSCLCQSSLFPYLPAQQMLLKLRETFLSNSYAIPCLQNSWSTSFLHPNLVTGLQKWSDKYSAEDNDFPGSPSANLDVLVLCCRGTLQADAQLSIYQRLSKSFSAVLLKSPSL